MCMAMLSACYNLIAMTHDLQIETTMKVHGSRKIKLMVSSFVNTTRVLDAQSLVSIVFELN